MSSRKGVFVTALNCIDGRAQGPVHAWVQEHYYADFVDSITEPGVDRVLAEGGRETIESIRHKVEISVRAHGSALVVIAGHYDCAGNPVSKEEHIAEIKKDVQTVASWGFPVECVGLWVNEQWEAEEVAEK